MGTGSHSEALTAELLDLRINRYHYTQRERGTLDLRGKQKPVKHFLLYYITYELAVQTIFSKDFEVVISVGQRHFYLQIDGTDTFSVRSRDYPYIYTLRSETLWHQKYTNTMLC